MIKIQITVQPTVVDLTIDEAGGITYEVRDQNNANTRAIAGYMEAVVQIARDLEPDVRLKRQIQVHTKLLELLDWLPVETTVYDIEADPRVC